MDATIFTIQNRERPFSAAISTPEHFTLAGGQPADPQLLIDEPGWSPYCLDDENRCVLFLNTPPEVDFSKAAFVYNAQFDHAQRAMMVPYAALAQVTASLQAPETLILLYSIGRCGSTLLSKVFSQVEGVYSLSEPDIYTNLSYLRDEKAREAELIQVVESCTLLLCAGRQTAAIKFRSHAIGISHWLGAAFPAARNIFMYRNALTWAQSVNRFVQRLGFAPQLPRDEALRLWRGLTGLEVPYIEPYTGARAEKLYLTDLLGPGWASYMDRYMESYQRGVSFHTVRYENLNERRESTLKAIFDYCNLPASALEEAMHVFETDSQAGTDISRDVPVDDLPPERIEQFLANLSRHPRFNQPDLTLPEHPRSAR